MSKRKPGEWWDKSWSIVTGCTPAGAACDRCWARSLVRRFPAAHAIGPISAEEWRSPGLKWLRDLGGPVQYSEKGATLHPAFSEVVCHPERLDEPLRRRKPTIYAVSLLGDLFHGQVPVPFIVGAFRVMLDRTDHTFVGLTKRPARAAQVLMSAEFREPLHRPPAEPNFILMASAWDQPSTDAACAALSSVPGLRWGLHLEPLLAGVDLEAVPSRLVDSPGGTRSRQWPVPRWIVAGGENGPGARPMDPQWALDLRDQCREAGVPFWFKGWGTKARVGSDERADWAGEMEQTREVPWLSQGDREARER